MTAIVDRAVRPARINRRRIGEHRVTYLPDGAAFVDPFTWLPESDDRVWAEHNHLLNPRGCLVASIGALLIEYADRAMLIDTGCGPLAAPNPYGHLNGGQLPQSLATSGVRVADIELIAVTHLDPHHIGWLAQPELHHGRHCNRIFGEVPVLVSATEWDHSEISRYDTDDQPVHTFADQVRATATGKEIFPGVHTFPTPGHTIGHMGYLIESRGHRLIAFGDAFTTSAQITHPHLTTADEDLPALSRATAMRLLNELSRPDTIGFGLHFADQQFGTVIHHEHGTTWQPQ